ncbi:MAG: hypothetical protein DMG22_09120 [Acidobacteria bacterium]|nr:MAG: hypothetical protein DMG22_09120 [Acidobacteriota bacterium]
MSAQLNDSFTPELRDILNNLASGLFGLDAWIKKPGKYKPPLPDEHMPWRAAGHTFLPSDLGVIPFFEGLLREDSGEDDLFDRWAELTANPVRFSPMEDVQGWRRNRGLASVPQFGVTKSANVLLTDSMGHAISRRKFYEPCWPLLQATVATRLKTGPVDYGKLANDLATDLALESEWPRTQKPPSSIFIAQFVCDLLYAMLGMRNSVAAPMQYALLAELGEFRRAGNAYKPVDATKNVEALRRLLDELQDAPPSPPATPPVHPAVGSPPHDKI